MTHFVTLAYLQIFAPWLLLLLGAQLGVFRRVLLFSAMALAASRLFAPPQELFSRQLAADAIAHLALIGVAASVWRSAHRRDLLAAFAFTLVAAGNDIVVIAAATVLASAAAQRPRAWPLLAAALVFAYGGETDLALVAHQSTVVLLAFAGLCAAALPWRFGSLVAVTALCVRIVALARFGPAPTWFLH